MITRLTVALRPVPAARVYEGWRLESFAAGAALLRRLVQDGPLPTVLRLSDEAETALNLAGPSELGAGEGGCLAIVGYEGDAADVSDRRERANRVRRRPERPPAGHRRALGSRPLQGPVPARRAARRRGDGRNARDGDVLVRRCRGCTSVCRRRCASRWPRRGRTCSCLPHLARISVRRVAVLHGRLRAASRSGGAVAHRQGGGERRDPRCRAVNQHHHGVGTDHVRGMRRSSASSACARWRPSSASSIPRAN